MAKDELRMVAEFPVAPERIYEAWLSSEGHAAMTGAGAKVDAKVGGRHEAWDGYIEGSNVALDPGKRIVQRWRSADFPADAADSLLEVLLDAIDGGTRVTLVHTEIPAGQGVNYEKGWVDFYFTPMAKHFVAAPKKKRAPAKKKAPAKAVKKPVAKKPAAKKAPAKAAKKPVAKKPAAKKSKG